MAQIQPLEQAKRKRPIDDAGDRNPRQQQSPLAHPFHSRVGPPSFISYLPRSHPTLRIIPAEGDVFRETLELLYEYDVVMDRHESLAANLGAKLTGPRLLRGIEKMFDGPVKVTPLHRFSEPVTWLDIVFFARANPQEFTLTQSTDGSRCCCFTLKGSTIEITEDDWRLIRSGALDRFPLDQQFEEDETAELATLDILEQRTSALFKEADKVAASARILNHKIRMRRQELKRRREPQDGASNTSNPAEYRIDQQRSDLNQGYDLHSDLLQQFAVAASSFPSEARSGSGQEMSMFITGQPPTSGNALHHHHAMPSGNPAGEASDAEPTAPAPPQSREASFRTIMTQRIEKMERGDKIFPPCDRCRRIKAECVKHLTACSGCTKRHCKCTWKDATEEEIRQKKGESSVEGKESEQRVASERPPEPRLQIPVDTSEGRDEHQSEGTEVSEKTTTQTNVSEDSAPARTEAFGQAPVRPAAPPAETTTPSRAVHRTILPTEPVKRLSLPGSAPIDSVGSNSSANSTTAA